MNPQGDILALFGRIPLSFESILSASPYDYRMTKDCVSMLTHRGLLERMGSFYRITERGIKSLQED